MTLQNRTLVLCVAFGTLIGAGMSWVSSNVDTNEKRHTARVKQVLAMWKQHDETIGKAEQLAESARTVEEWEGVLAFVHTLPPSEKISSSDRATIGMLEAVTGERDRLLRNAGELYGANAKDPGIEENLNKARALHERANALLGKLERKENSLEWNVALQYRKAYEKYRSLAFIRKEEHDKALDILDDAMKNLQSANALAPKRIGIEEAIEFLYKRAQEEENRRGTRDGAPDRPRALPPRANPDGPGSGGSNRPRRH
ncbi:MAG TPA: hypothetical protein VJH33_00210 [Candidatus Paceibacterota bacterium]